MTNLANRFQNDGKDHIREIEGLICEKGISLEEAISRKISEGFYVNTNAALIRIIKEDANYPDDYCPLILEVYDMTGKYKGEFQKRFENSATFENKLPAHIANTVLVPLSTRPSFIAKRNHRPSFPKMYCSFDL